MRVELAAGSLLEAAQLPSPRQFRWRAPLLAPSAPQALGPQPLGRHSARKGSFFGARSQKLFRRSDPENSAWIEAIFLFLRLQGPLTL